jgi:signal transduction histidine kinase
LGLELAQIAAGLPFAVSFAVAGGIASLREGRRRSALNEAVHELRRPLQALALTAPARHDDGGVTLRMAVTALERLDRVINGEAPAVVAERVDLGSIAVAAVDRWRRRAELAGGSVGLRWRAGRALLDGDADALARALDNMIINGLEHGGSELVVEGCEVSGGVRLVVRDSGAASPPGRRKGLVAARDPRGRHGHGLRVVRRAAAAHRGRFRLRDGEGGTEAVLELPTREPAP